MMTELTFWNASLISPSTFSFCARSIVCSLRAARKTHDPLDCRSRGSCTARPGVLRTRSNRENRSSPQAASDAWPLRAVGIADFFDGGCYLFGSSVAGLLMGSSCRGRFLPHSQPKITRACLLYTSDAADERSSVDL